MRHSLPRFSVHKLCCLPVEHIEWEGIVKEYLGMQSRLLKRPHYAVVIFHVPRVARWQLMDVCHVHTAQFLITLLDTRVVTSCHILANTTTTQRD